MKELYDIASQKTSKDVTKLYSTSFTLGIKMLEKSLQQPVYNIYGFVRLADEIVDSFHGFNKTQLLADFRKQTFQAIEEGISTNPILHAFQLTVRKYNIEHSCIHTFLDSMEMDLKKTEYGQSEYEQYILGSAEVVGCMCLSVFVKGDINQYETLKPFAMKLGSAFQKINFLRDLQEDYKTLGRTYFPGVDFEAFNSETLSNLIADIEKDFKLGLDGIIKLPNSSKLGVYLAYIYYTKLLHKIKCTSHREIMKRRIRISNKRKAWLLFQTYFKYQFKLI